MHPLLALASLLCLALAGCSDDAASAGTLGDGDVQPTGPAAAATREEPLSVAGTTPVGGCAGTMLAGRCVYEAGDGNLQELGSGALRVSGTLTWSAATPATATMGVLALVPYPGGGWTARPGLPSVYGSSPLQVDLDLSGIAEPVALWFSAYNGFSEGGAWVGAQVPQDFAFEGLVTAPA